MGDKQRRTMEWRDSFLQPSEVMGRQGETEKFVALIKGEKEAF